MLLMASGLPINASWADPAGGDGEEAKEMNVERRLQGRRAIITVDEAGKVTGLWRGEDAKGPQRSASR